MAKTHYIEYDPATNEIKRAGFCDVSFIPEPEPGNVIALRQANPTTQKFIDGAVVNKTAEELLASRLLIPSGEKRMVLTKDQWNGILNRVASLEEKAKAIAP
jgi:hypothetical protein